MAACCCSLAGTAACRTCSCNPNAETPPPVRSYTTIATNGVLATWKTNADKIRQMSDEELAEWLAEHQKIGDAETHRDGYRQLWFDWLKQEVSE